MAEISNTQAPGLNIQRNLPNAQKQSVQSGEGKGPATASATGQLNQATGQNDDLVQIASKQLPQARPSGEQGPRLGNAASAADAAANVRSQSSEEGSKSFLNAQSGMPDYVRQLATSLLRG